MLGNIRSLFGIATPVVVIPQENYSGAVMVFAQTSAPQGWTKQTDNDDCALRCVTGSSLSTGGTNGFISTFTDRTFGGTATMSSGTSGATTLSTPQLPSHTHTFVGGYAATKFVRAGTIPTAAPATVFRAWPSSNTAVSIPGGNWSGGSHTHSIPPYSRTNSSIGTIGLAVKYLDVIIASKD